MDTSPEPPEIKRTGGKWLDLMLALSAIFVSMCSLWLAYNSSNSMERLVQANSMPFIQLESGNATDEGEPGVLGFAARNAGTGPARVHSFRYIVDGQAVQRHGYVTVNILRACCATELDAALAAANGDVLAVIDADLTSPVANTFFAAGDKVTAWSWRRTAINATLWNAVDQARQEGRIGMRACYCSLFDDCWIAETGTFPPRPVNECPLPAQQSPAPNP
ncbi:MAG: hypothetical protein ABL871_15520 [Terricaulis sp.]